MTETADTPETAKPQKPQSATVGKVALFFATALIFYQILIVAPAIIWAGNANNFEAQVTDALPIFLSVLLGIITISAIVAFLVPAKWRRVITPLFALIAAALLIQQNFLNWNYGILDGAALDFSKNNMIGLVDLVIWVGVVAAFVLARKWIARQMSNILIGVGAIASLLLAMNILSLDTKRVSYSIDETDKYNFSKDKNVIVFLFDAFQMDFFLEVLANDPELEDAFDGFTLYENKSAVFAKTYPTIPMFLTGKRYQKEVPILDFFETVYDDSMVVDMQSEGWDVGLHPDLESFPALINAIKISPDVMDNVVLGISINEISDNYFRALDLGLFRSVPHQIKPILYDNGNFKMQSALSGIVPFKEEVSGVAFKYDPGENHKAIAFREELNSYGKVDIDEPVFRFFHLLVPHAPFSLDENLNKVPVKYNLDAHKKYSVAGVKLMRDYLDELHRLGVYDSASIMILSDHGLGMNNKLQFDPDTNTMKRVRRDAVAKAAAKSILLIKEPNAKGSLTRSSKPVSGIDIAPTLADFVGVDGSEMEGLSVRDIENDQNRERIFNFYRFSTWDSKYLDDFLEFKISGDVRDSKSWTKIGLKSAENEFSNPAKYELGQILTYGSDIKSDSDFSNAFITEGDYASKANYLEFEAGKANLEIEIESKLAASGFLKLQFEIYSGDPAMRIVEFNNQSFKEYVKPLKRKLNNGFFVRSDLDLGDEKVLLSFSQPNDNLPVPLRLAAVRLTKLEPTLIKVEQAISSFESLEEYYPVGFASVRRSGTWTVSDEAGLIFAADRNLCVENNLVIDVGQMATGIAPSDVQAVLNDQVLPQIGGDPLGPRTYNCSAARLGDANTLYIKTPKTVLDKSITDNHPVSVRIDGIAFQPK